MAKRGDVFLGDVRGAERVQADRVTWRESADRKHDDRDPDQSGDRIQDPPDDVLAHLPPVTSGVPTRREPAHPRPAPRPPSSSPYLFLPRLSSLTTRPV